MQRYDERQLDMQPEKDQPAWRLLSLGTGLIAGCGLILGALLGALVGHFLLEDALGTTLDIVIPAIIGGLVVVAIGVIAIRRMSSRIATSERRRMQASH